HSLLATRTPHLLPCVFAFEAISVMACTSLSRSCRRVYTCGVMRTQLMFSHTMPTVCILYWIKSAFSSSVGVMPSMLTPQIAQEYSGLSEVCSFTLGISLTREAQ